MAASEEAAAREAVAPAGPVVTVAAGDFLNLHEAAAFVGVHADTMKRQIDKGRLPALVFGRTYRIRRADLLALLATTPGGGRQVALDRALETVETAVRDLRSQMFDAGVLQRAG
jgi:excisionase family DNA binding protein